MATTKSDLADWFHAAPVGATHLIVVCDEISWEDFPVYVLEGEDARTRQAEETVKPLAKVMEVYHLGYSFEKQAAMKRAFVYELPLDGHDDRVLALLGSIPDKELRQGTMEWRGPARDLAQAEIDRRAAYARAAEEKKDRERQAALDQQSRLCRAIEPESLPVDDGDEKELAI